MELNAVANIQACLTLFKDGLMSEEEFETNIKIELDTLERYMVGIGKILHNNNIRIPKWHEIKANPQEHPLRREI